MDSVATDSDWLTWCKTTGMYVTKDELRSRMLSGIQTLIVDVRDDDHQGVRKTCTLLPERVPLRSF